MPDRRLIDLFSCASLLVGAPRDHSPHDIIARRGAVWKCEFQADDRCQRVAFRRDGKNTADTCSSSDLFFKAKSTFVSVLHSIIKQINGSALHWRPTMGILSYVVNKYLVCAHCSHGLRSRPVHPFSSIVSTTGKILSTKYRAVLSSANMEHPYR